MMPEVYPKQFFHQRSARVQKASCFLMMPFAAKSEYVIADLTDCNPNVFYELGIAHCVKEADKVILLTQSMDFVPFDLRHLRCIVYKPTVSGLDVLKDELIETFHEVARDSFRFNVREGSRIPFGKKLVGHNSNLFELTFNVVHIGYGVVKMSIDFAEHAIDQESSKVDSQFLMLNEDEWSVQTVNNIPWRLHLSQYSDNGAVLVLEKS